MPIDDIELFQSLMIQAENAMSLGRYEDALLIFETIEEECIQNNLDELLGSTYSAIAEIYRRQDNKQLAIKMFKQSCEACRKVLENPYSLEHLPVRMIRENLRGSLGNLADMVRDSKDYHAALTIYKEMETVARSLDEMHWVQASLNNQGFIYLQFKEWGAAIKAYREQEKICRNEKIKKNYFEASIFRL